MAPRKKGLTDSVLRFLSKRRPPQPNGAATGSARPHEALIFDTITLESVMNHRGQNPFPEEEGELRFMQNILRGRPLESR
jgi:hypothetical protein